MCGRFGYSSDTVRTAADRMTIPVPAGSYAMRDAHPGDITPVISSVGFEDCKWGYPGFSGKNLVFNTRSETALEKNFFRNGILHGRIIIAASLFYEWDPSKQMYEFRREDSAVMFLAGIMDRFDGVKRYSVLTTAANPSMSQIHNRMPLILERNQLSDWIQDDSTVFDILRQTPVLLHARRAGGQLSMFD